MSPMARPGLSRKEQKKRYCSSQYGYRLHLKYGEAVCEPCRLAMNAVNQASRDRNPETEAARHIAYREYIAKRNK